MPRKNTRYCFGMMAGLLLIFQGRVDAADRKPIVAVFNIEVKGLSLSADLVDRLTDYLCNRVTAAGVYQVVPREQIRERIRSQKRDTHSACYDESCQIEVGRELAAEKSLDTQVLKLGGMCTVTATLYDLMKATTDQADAVKCQCTEDSIAAALETIAGMIGGAKNEKEPDKAMSSPPVKIPEKTIEKTPERIVMSPAKTPVVEKTAATPAQVPVAVKTDAAPPKERENVPEKAIAPAPQVPIRAEERKAPHGLAISALFGVNLCIKGSGEFATCTDLEPSFGFTGGLMYRFFDYLAIEANFAYGMFSPPIGKFSSLGVFGGPRGFLPLGPIDLSLGVGFGWGKSKAEDSGDNFEMSGFALGISLGAQYLIVKSFGIGVLAEIFFPFYSEKCGDFGSGYECIDPSDYMTNMMIVGVNATYYFGI